ncbi:MAG: c-type cytochrome [Nitrospirota bacterium]|nr:c-type cytochrome [Nitrospirota bacterium]MDE3051668.1 c-type cytochrome [Nitrospirota bacterium]MDE3219821.1 c-type cytochrome [Nitrospirota bacterium]
MKNLRLLVLFSASCVLVTGLEAPLTSAASGEPAKGKLIYETNCLICHGARGKGDGLIGATLRPPPADLTGPKARATSDKDLLTVIQDGRAAMPAWKSRLKEQDIENVLAYIRSLGE